MNKTLVEIPTSREIWKEVKGYEGMYSVSNMGRIHSLRVGMIMKPRENNKGYMRIRFIKNKRGREFLVHRIVAQTFFKKPHWSRNEVNHLDKNPKNNKLENLEWCTRLENMDHALGNKLITKVAKLKTSGEVIKIFDSFDEAKLKGFYNGDNEKGFKWFVFETKE